ncbi:MAG: cyclopropane-fatty-acyl-phospholipid synthase family protein [Pseudomonadota bacterium]|nr:cyclopropane-fatty-acyl-phospholipid synthase family protein [Pseudomonadota bacterium]
MIEAIARRFVRVGNLTLIDAQDRKSRFGDGSGPAVTVKLHGRFTALKIALQPTLMLGECYMNGTLEVVGGDVYAFLELIGRNFDHDPIRQHRQSWPRRVWFSFLRRIRQINGRIQAQRNIHVHYDISNDLYRRFLDPDMQYSCAYFARPDMPLDEAQIAKKAHIAAKLLLESHHRVLDIGCGWGGLGLTLASYVPEGGVTGVTLSEEQLALAQERSAARVSAGMQGADFRLQDYRDVAGPFDRIVSVGMFEHVGQPNYQEYFDQIARLLTEDGVAVVHSIGRKDEPGLTNPFIAKYIFPGGYIPALSEVLPHIERAGLWVTDVEILRLHYAETLKAWRVGFAADRDAIRAIHDEQFCRMFEFYLAVSEIAFRFGGHMVFQLQLTRRIDAAPITRDYIYEGEREIVRQPKMRVAR